MLLRIGRKLSRSHTAATVNGVDAAAALHGILFVLSYLGQNEAERIGIGSRFPDLSYSTSMQLRAVSAGGTQ